MSADLKSLMCLYTNLDKFIHFYYRNAYPLPSCSLKNKMLQKHNLLLNNKHRVPYECCRPLLRTLVTSSQILRTCHLLLPWLVFVISGLEQGWLVQCQYKVTSEGIMFISSMVPQYQCPGTSKH